MHAKWDLLSEARADSQSTAVRRGEAGDIHIAGYPMRAMLGFLGGFIANVAHAKIEASRDKK